MVGTDASVTPWAGPVASSERQSSNEETTDMRNDHFIRRAHWATPPETREPIGPRVLRFTLELAGLACFFAIAAMVLCLI